MEYMVTAQTEWYEEVASGVRRIRMPEADVDWMDINLDKAGEDLDAFVPNPEVGQLMLERFSECGRLRVADATLIRMEVPIEFLDTEEELRIAITLTYGFDTGPGHGSRTKNERGTVRGTNWGGLG